ncbi:MAG: DNA-3-methyladenine glycosylase 2 family protein [Chloroflexi bacterium]|nr:MAG: DNA-3-methyladenine glycosylase 2 family protein [Chloroflexota bacterium]TME87234.1 MAG: DNA-3-methyladenine glycosylase 2 family protein [Chloroflexota bacterium]
MATSVPLDEPTLARAVHGLARAEPRFAQIVKRHGSPPLWPREPGFQTLVLLMLEQQVSLAQGRAMYARIANATGTVTPANVSRLGEAGLRAIGVTRQKSSYLAALATQLEEKAVDLDALGTLSDVDADAALDALRGVGPWTAQCYLLFALRRADVFPAADLALMEAVRDLWKLRARPSPDALARRARAWRPHRAVAARLLWHHYLSERGRS